MKKRESTLEPTQWIHELKRNRADSFFIEKAIGLVTQISEPNSSLIIKGLEIADILLTLGLDNDALAAAITYPLYAQGLLSTDIVLQEIGEGAGKLLKDVVQMRSIHTLQHLRNQHQVENLRKMLLAIISDVRSILIVMAERLLQLRESNTLAEDLKKLLANEVISIYAPLANRLGIWQFKWEMEDLSLKCLQPEVYSSIAKALASRRHEREEYIDKVKSIVTNHLNQAGIVDFEIMGRVKHIHSIYQKMKRKDADFKNIYDISALRVLVNTIEDCYTVLSIFQNAWLQIQEEFDDYIAQPKSNGYQSIHTVVRGPDGHLIEIQIRTKAMHKESELGIAAHWRYKEGVLQTSNYETKIGLLRQIMVWQKDLFKSDAIQSSADIFADRIYVFTPNGEVVDLPKGSTPLDFAYHIHSEVGHRCKGAKVDGLLVSLKHKLQTGSRVEILTAKHPHPSRDWLNQHLGYLATPRARSKVQHWFRIQSTAENSLVGKELLDKEMKKINAIPKYDLNEIAKKFNYKFEIDLLAAIGSGEVRVSTVLQHILPAVRPIKDIIKVASTNSVGLENKFSNPDIKILGVNNLLTHISKCCKPTMTDTIMGYVTRNRGISIHKANCRNITQFSKLNKDRLIEVDWSKC